jgi:hypothetical protein
MKRILARPRLLGLVCGTAAVATGLTYLFAAGAPSRYLLVNLAALAIGAIIWLALSRAADMRLAGAGYLVLALSLALMATAIFGVTIEGASRWIRVGPLTLQVSLVLLPAMVVLYARQPEMVGTAGMIIAAAALAMQPDRAMAGALLLAVAALGLAVLALTTPARISIVAALTAALAFGWTLLWPDALPAVPYVEGVFASAFDVHPVIGVAVAVGTAILVLPAVIGALRGTDERPVFLAFGGCWAGIALAAALGNYPTPLVGYGAAAVLGYFLSVALLPRLSASSA